MIEWPHQTEFLLCNTFKCSMYISLTSWKNGITQLKPGGLVMFYSFLIHILGKKWVTLDWGIETTYSCKLCVCMGTGWRKCCRVDSVSSQTWDHDLEHLDPWVLIVGSAANSAEKWGVCACVPTFWFIMECQTFTLMWWSLLPLFAKQTVRHKLW